MMLDLAGLLRRWLAPIAGARAAVREPHTSKPSVAVPAKAWSEPRPLGEEAQWSKASSVVTDAIGRASHALELQAAAAGHLDAAKYALDQLLLELAAAMPVPGRIRAPVVHRIEPKAMPERRRVRIAA